MLPFGIPQGLRNAVGNNIQAQSATKTLKTIGLIIVILPIALIFGMTVINILSAFTGNMFFQEILELVCTLLFYALFITYWVKAVSFRKKYLK